MKQKLIKIFTLFFAMSVLTASRENNGSCKVNLSTMSNGGDIAASAVKMPAVAPLAPAPALSEVSDDEISLSPISRFILVQ